MLLKLLAVITQAILPADVLPSNPAVAAAAAMTELSSSPLVSAHGHMCSARAASFKGLTGNAPWALWIVFDWAQLLGETGFLQESSPVNRPPLPIIVNPFLGRQKIFFFFLSHKFKPDGRVSLCRRGKKKHIFICSTWKMNRRCVSCMSPVFGEICMEY